MAGAGNQKRAPQPPVIILGSGIKAVAIMRCLGRAGIISCQALPLEGYERFCRWFTALPRGVSPLAQDDDLQSWLAGWPSEKAVLMPCSDSWSLKAASLPVALRARFPSSQAPLSVHQLILDQSRFCDLLKRYDLPHARTIFPCTEKALKEIGGRTSRRYLVKRCKPTQAACTAEKDAILPASFEESLAQIVELQKDGHAVMLQHFIPGGPSNHYYIDGFVDRYGEMHATFARQCLRMERGESGKPTALVSVPLHRVYPAVQSVTRLLKAIDYRGLYSVEFKFDSRDGVFKLLKMKGRPWRCIESALVCGLNMPAMAYADALGRELKVERGSYKSGVRFINFQEDIGLCRSHLGSKRRQKRDLSWSRLLREWATARPLLFRNSDPLPAFKVLWSNFISNKNRSAPTFPAAGRLLEPKLILSKGTSLAGSS